VPIKWDFEYSTTDGSPVVTISQWAHSLSTEDKKKWSDARIRQEAIREEKINDGSLQVTGNHGYIWKDETAELVNKKNDPVWEEMFARWRSECKIILNIKREEI
jgi:hypothetical protein